jgi:hypothetical protein
MRKLLLGIVCLFSIAWAEPKEIRKITVPASELPLLLQQGADRILMPESEYLQLKAKVKAHETSAPVTSKMAVHPLKVDLTVKLEEDHVVVLATCTLSGNREGMNRVLLDFGRVYWTQAQLDGVPAELAGTPGGKTEVFFEGRGTRILKLEGVSPLPKVQNRQQLALRVPELPGHLTLQVPAGMDVGESLQTGTVGEHILTTQTEANPMTHVRVLPEEGWVRGSVRLDRLYRPDPLKLTVQHTQRAEFAGRYEELTERVHVFVHHQPVQKLELEFPIGVHIRSISCREPMDWQGREEGGVQKVSVDFRNEVIGPVQLDIQALRRQDQEASWTPARTRVVGSEKETRLQELSVLPPWSVASIQNQDAEMVSVIHAVQAYRAAPNQQTFAWQLDPAGEVPEVQLIQKPLVIEAFANLFLVSNDVGNRLSGEVTLLPRNAGILEAVFQLPTEWRVEQVRLASQKLSFDVIRTSAELQEVRVMLPRKIASGEPVQFDFEASHTPEGWLDQAGIRSLVFPEFTVPDAETLTGAVAVDGGEFRKVRATQLEGLTPLDDRSKQMLNFNAAAHVPGYRFEKAGYELAVELKPMVPELRVQAFTFVRARKDGFSLRWEWLIDNQKAPLKEFSFVMPMLLPQGVRPVLEQSSLRGDVIRTELAGGQEQWMIPLVGNVEKSIRVILEADVPRTPDGSFRIPWPSHPDVEVQSGFLAVEGAAELDIQLTHSAREVDLGELSDATYQPGPRLIGTFAYTGKPEAGSLTLNAQELVEVLDTRLRRLSLDSVVSVRGEVQHQAVFILEEAPAFLSLRLPEDAEAWSVDVDAEAVEPRKGARGEWLIPVPSRRDRPLRTVRVVYRNDSGKTGFGTDLRLDAPVLSVYNDDGVHSELFPLETEWRVRPPEGYTLMKSKGTAVLRQQHEPELAVVNGAKFFAFLGGGVRVPFSWLTNFGAMSRTKSMTKSRGGYEYAEEAEVGEYPAADFEKSLNAPEYAATMDQRVEEAQMDRLMSDFASPGLSQGQGLNDPSVQGVVVGYRSLMIPLSVDDVGIPFYSLHPEPVVRISLMKDSTLSMLSFAVAVLVFAGGVGFMNRPRRDKLFYLVCVVLISVLPGILPMLSPLVQVFNAMCYAAMGLLFFYILVRILKVCWFLFSKPVLLLLGLAAGVVAHGDGLRTPDPLPIPKEVIVHVEGSAPGGVQKEDQVLVPRTQVENLQGILDQSTENTIDLKDTVGWREGVLSLRLSDQERLALEASYRFRLYADDIQQIQFPVSGAAVGEVLVDEKPARVEAKDGNLNIWVEGKGDHVLTLRLRAPVALKQGLRSIRVGVLPVPNLVTVVRIPEKGIRLEMGSGEETSRVWLTEQAEQKVTAPVGASGIMELSWSEAVPSTQSGRGLEVSAATEFHVLEDREVYVWNATVASKGAPVDRLRASLPEGWNVMSVEGRQVSGWERDKGQPTQLDIHFMQESTSEQVRVLLWRDRAVNAGDVQVPFVQVENAVRQTGNLELYHEKSLKLSVQKAQGIRREEIRNAHQKQTVQIAGDFETDATQVYQNFSFHDGGYVMEIQAAKIASEIQTFWQQLLRVSEREDVVEARCRLQVKGAAVHQLIFKISPDLEIKKISAPGAESWSQEGEQVMLLSPNGLSGDVSILMEGVLRTKQGNQQVLPSMSLEGAAFDSGTWVVLADPSMSVSLDTDAGIKRIPLNQTSSWLSNEQKPFARLALRYDTSGESAGLTFTELEPEVTVNTFTNVRVNHQVIEETLLVDATIRRAGLAEFSIRIPARYRDASIQAPLLREVRFEEDPADKEWGILTLVLQDRIMGQLVILLERDRSARDDRFSMQTPEVLTGRTHRSFLTVENAGRDELRIDKAEGVDALTRAHADWDVATELVGENVTFAYVGGLHGKTGRLEVVRLARERAVTAGARIGLSRIELQVDESASYMGRWTMWVDNRTEQLLHTRLPEGARLVMATVAGKEVNPVRVGGQTEADLHLPLVKTPLGEKDIQVQVIYAGSLDSLARLRKEGMPFPTCENIPVDLSQAKLYLPKSYRWLRFDGTMRKLQGENELQAGWLSYQAGLAERLTQTLKSGDLFEQARATHNINALKNELNERADELNGRVASAELEKAKRVIRDAEKEIGAQQLDQDAQTLSDNRMSFRGKFEEQSNDYSRNQVYWNPSNFDVTENDIEIQANAPANRQQPQGQSSQVSGEAGYGKIQTVLQRRQRETADPAPEQEKQWAGEKFKTRIGAKGKASKYLESLENKSEAKQQEPLRQRKATVFPEPDTSRMDVFVFSTPRGHTRITAVSLSERAITALIRFTVFLLVLGLMVLMKRRPAGNEKRKYRFATPFIIIGVFGFLSGNLPVYSIILFIGGLVGVMQRSSENRPNVQRFS